LDFDVAARDGRGVGYGAEGVEGQWHGGGPFGKITRKEAGRLQRRGIGCFAAENAERVLVFAAKDAKNAEVVLGDVSL
jgi:hypothetical protein